MNIKELAQMITPPLADIHPRTWELLRRPGIYDDGTTDLFGEAMRENASWHCARNEAYRKYCEHSGYDPDDGSLGLPPPLSAATLKAIDLVTVSSGDVLELSSSGTTGTSTRVVLDAETVMRMWAMAANTFAEEGLVSTTPVNYLIFGLAPTQAGGHGNSMFFEALMQFAPGIDRFYALRRDRSGVLDVDLSGVLKVLADWSKGEAPVRVFGPPPFIVEMLRRSDKGAVRLPGDSLVLTGGGWKKRGDEAITKANLRELLAEKWGVPDKRVRDLYGMTEHANHFLECPNHRFHSTSFSRVDIVDPITKAPVPEGDCGIIHLQNPGFTSMPVLSLLTADVGRWVACSCSRRTPAFEVLGRGGKTPHKGCALRSAEASRRTM